MAKARGGTLAGRSAAPKELGAGLRLRDIVRRIATATSAHPAKRVRMVVRLVALKSRSRRSQ